MKIKEIIREDLDPSNDVNDDGLETKTPPHHHTQPMRNATTFPGQNMSTGSAYMNYRFGVALARSEEHTSELQSH